MQQGSPPLVGGAGASVVGGVTGALVVGGSMGAAVVGRTTGEPVVGLATGGPVGDLIGASVVGGTTGEIVVGLLTGGVGAGGVGAGGLVGHHSPAHVVSHSYSLRLQSHPPCAAPLHPLQLQYPPASYSSSGRICQQTSPFASPRDPK